MNLITRGQAFGQASSILPPAAGRFPKQQAIRFSHAGSACASRGDCAQLLKPAGNSGKTVQRSGPAHWLFQRAERVLNWLKEFWRGLYRDLFSSHNTDKLKSTHGHPHGHDGAHGTCSHHHH